MCPILIDVILLAILALFLFAGIRRGLISSLAGLLSLILAFVGATFLAQTFSPTVSQWIAPHIETIIVEKIEDATSSVPPDVSLSPASMEPKEKTQQAAKPSESDALSKAALTESNLVAFLKRIGLYDSVAKYIAEATSQQMSQTENAISSALALSLANLIAYWGILILSFILLRIALSILVHALNLVARLPVLHLANHIGGGIFGFAEGVLILFLLAWLLRFFGNLIPEDIVEQTTILRFFIHANSTALLPKL